MKKTSNLKTNWASRHLKYFLITLMLLLMSACGGGGGGGEDDGTIGTGIQGTAAIGAAIANATITVKSKSGAIKTATSDTNGKFKVTELVDDGPYLLRTDKGNGDFLYSVAHKAGSDTINRNIHPYTDLIIRNWFETQGQDIDSAFAGSAAIPNMPTEQSVNAIKNEVYNIVAQVLVSNGVTGEIDLLSTPFDANSTGFDAFLDNAPVIINNNQITVVINDPVTNIQNIVINNIYLNTDFTSSENSAPTTPDEVRALAASTTEIIVVWEASTDDKGVTGYNVYRNGDLIATTPYPVYSDTGLSTGTEYFYEIEAVDGRGELSAKSGATTPITLDTTDNIDPPAPTNLLVAVSGDDVSLSWDQAQINDVYGFRILRGSAGNVSTEIANITSMTYTDFNLVSATNYCYKVIAYDAAGNESNSSEESCSTTGGTTPESSSVSFSASTYTVMENASSIAITVNRSGNISEAISVVYTVSNGTATDGTDFTAASGTLNWAVNDSNAQTFNVQIMSDSATEGNETVNLELSSPSANTALGANTTAILTITDFVAGVCNGEITDSSITEDTTLSEPCYAINSDISVQNAATLTIQPGVTLQFAAGKELSVKSDGALNAVGTPTAPIIFTGAQQTPGYWDGINYLNSNNVNNELKYVTVEYGGAGGGANLEINSTTRIKLSNTTLRQSAGYGVLFGNSAIIDLFANNTLTTNEGAPVRIPANKVGKLDSQSSYTGNVANREYISIFETSNIEDDQTWQALNVPYKLHNNSVEAVLTIDPRSTLIFRQGGNFRIERTGTLIARGTATNNIIFTGENKTPGSWHGLQFTFSGTANELDHVSVEYAGGTNGNGNGAVTLFGTPGRLKIHNTIISDSLQYGLDVSNAAHILDISTVSFINSVDGSVLIDPNLVGKLDTNSTYNDPIVFDSGAFVSDQTIKNLGVSYYVGTHNISSSIIIEEGTTLSFAASGGFRVDRTTGSLTAIGTAALPITFTGRQQVPGYWKGLEFFSNSFSNKLDNCIVEYAGAPGGNTQGLVGVFFNDAVVDVTNSLLQHSATNGLWLYDSTAGIHTGNTFSNIDSGINVFIR